MRLARAAYVIGVLAAVVLPGVARADENPHLVSRNPYDGAVVKPQNAPDFTATYDRDLMGPPLSSIQVFDNRAVAVAGDLRLTGPASPTGGRRSITFTPSAPFREGLSPYSVRIFVQAEANPTATAQDESRFHIDGTAPLVPTILTPADRGALKPAFEIRGTTSPTVSVRVIGSDAFFPSTESDPWGEWRVGATLPEGIHTFWATATDAAGNESAASSAVTVTVDGTAPPAPVITSPLPGETVRTLPVRLSGTAEPANALYVFEGTFVLPCLPNDGCFLAATTSSDHSSGAWSASAALPDGPHTLKIIATDAAGNRSATSSLDITVDASEGAPLITSPKENALIGSSTVTIAGTSIPGWTVRLTEGDVLLATAAVAPGGTWSASVTLSDGLRTIAAQATDGIETTGTRLRRLRIDTTGPEPPVFASPTAGGVTSAKDAQINGTAEPNSVVRVYEGQALLGLTAASALGNWGIEAQLAPGPHAITADATDRAGNRGAPAGVSFTADDQKPTLQVTTLDPYASALETFRIEGRAQDNDMVVRVIVTFRDTRRALVLTENAVMSPVGGPDIAWRANGTGLNRGVYMVQIQALDRAGNFSAASTITAIKIT